MNEKNHITVCGHFCEVATLYHKDHNIELNRSGVFTMTECVNMCSLVFMFSPFRKQGRFSIGNLELKELDKMTAKVSRMNYPMSIFPSSIYTIALCT